MLNFPLETGFCDSVCFEEMDTVTLLPSGTSVEFTSSAISTDLAITVSLGNEVMTAVTALTGVSHWIDLTLELLPPPPHPSIDM